MQAMGGTQAWQNVRESEAEGATTINGGPPLPFHWKDNWATKGHMERSGPDTHGKQRHFIADEGEKVTLKGEHDGVPKPTCDRVAQLMLYMPGAVISLVLDDTHYGIEPAKSATKMPAAECVSIYRDRMNIGRGGVQAVLCFNRQSSLPERGAILLPNLAQYGVTVAEKFQYKGFQSSGLVLVPKFVDTMNPVGVHRLYTFTSVRTGTANPNAGGQQ